MNVIILITEYYRVRMEYIGEGIVLYVSTASDVDPPQQTIKPHYFTGEAEAKKWMIEAAYGMLRVGYEIAAD